MNDKVAPLDNGATWVIARNDAIAVLGIWERQS